MTAKLTIATRGSPLALAQAHEVRDRLAACHDELAADGAVEILVIRTTGDRIQTGSLAEAGGKGLFTKEIEDALLAGRAHIAVHSMKDVPTWLPDGLIIDCLLPREDPRDAFISPKAATVAALPKGAMVGTASLRRRAILLHQRPDLRIEIFRGNVETRLAKLADGVVDATLLAAAGLRRLGKADRITSFLETTDMLPAVCQGAVGIELRAYDGPTRQLVAAIHDTDCAIRVAAERAFLAALDGSCRTPLAGLAELADDRLVFRGLVVRPDGSEMIAAMRTGPASDAEAMGRDAGLELRGKAGPGFFDEPV